jgi:hypothetical protein
MKNFNPGTVACPRCGRAPALLAWSRLNFSDADPLQPTSTTYRFACTSFDCRQSREITVPIELMRADLVSA